MNKNELAELLAREANLSPAEAADELDRIVSRLLRALRRGAPARLPGFGSLLPEGSHKPVVKPRNAPRDRTRS